MRFLLRVKTRESVGANERLRPLQGGERAVTIRDLAFIAVLAVAACTSLERPPDAEDVARPYLEDPARPRVTISGSRAPGPDDAKDPACVYVVEVDY